MKSTWCQVNGEGREIFKDPKTDDGVKKSLKGLIYVGKNSEGSYFTVDQCNDQIESTGELQTVYENGKILVNTSLSEIRERVNKTL